MTAVEPTRPGPADRPAGDRVALLAETPDAGRYHHRFLVSPASGLDAAAAADWFARYGAAPDGAGPDFLGVDRDVVQRATGRTGRETLLVIGLDVDRLAPAEREAIRSRLRDRLPRLAELAATIDWDRDPGLLGECPALADGIDPDWPVAARRPTFVPTETPHRRPRSGTFVGLAVFLMTVAGIVFW